jgi:hypothetical protein
MDTSYSAIDGANALMKRYAPAAMSAGNNTTTALHVTYNVPKRQFDAGMRHLDHCNSPYFAPPSSLPTLLIVLL